jgi:hypothetical protein
MTRGGNDSALQAGKGRAMKVASARRRSPAGSVSKVRCQGIRLKAGYGTHRVHVGVEE